MNSERQRGTEFARYAVYYAPAPGELADFAAAWLGWDPAAGREAPHPALAGLPRSVAEITAQPRRYGFHATVKAPFRLAEDQTAAALDSALAALAAQIPPVRLDGLRLARLGGFLALVPEGDTGALHALAARVVRALEPFRAPLSEAEITRRKPESLTATQRENLASYGYPYVMEAFRFHMTLTGDLPEQEADAVTDALAPALAPLLPRPFAIDALCLFGEDAAGRFHILDRHALRG